ncbi:MAG: bifunctional phosphoribosyl-AMP cyclohydrolase/phosphoribosyl-ATP diphosphatase HisIE [Neisseriaceae bacterium]|nr:MAG: bifunctional phosphoribosyl-AMP cyclohydrolase/phosphoribosyl-ATP diphosphatase HisIE [Neisseriaceae bacterium]
MALDINKIDFNKNADGLVPVVVQENDTLQVLMLGYMNQEAVNETLQSKKVTFYSRTKQRLWVKGETSENYLMLNDIHLDCDNDTILVMATPCGPTCHTGDISCFGKEYSPALSKIGMMDKVIRDRIANPTDGSYTNQLIKRGLNKVSQKVGEEAVEVVIAALAETDAEYIGEMTDLLYHSLVLLHAKKLELSDIAEIIDKRHQAMK